MIMVSPYTPLSPLVTKHVVATSCVHVPGLVLQERSNGYCLEGATTAFIKGRT